MARRWRRRGVALAALVLAVAGVCVGAEVATHRLAFVVTHGVSMNPVYYQGDLVIVARSAPYHRGEIVAYRVPAKHMVVLHRIIGGDSAGFVMKGDNNQSIDPTHPAQQDVIGHAVIHIPHGGLWLDRATNPAVLGLVAFALTIAGGARARTRRRRQSMSRHADLGRRRSRAGSLPPPMRAASGVLAVSVLLAVMLGVVAWTASPRAPHRVVSSTGRQVVFSYTASVARSAAYDTTTVSSPDPVFRRLTNAVQLHVTYHGAHTSPAAPVRLGILARLSAASGWHTSIPLASPAVVTSSRYHTTVPLDLRAFDARARLAAAVTGMPAAPLTVALTARVSTPGEALFEPSIALNLTPLQLSLASDPAAMTVNDTSTIATTGSAPALLHLPFLHLRVTTARWIASGSMLAALLVLAVLALLSRRCARLTEAQAIRRRYAPLLAAVDPITVPHDLPVIDVADFPTLARVAERGCQLILHWSRSGIDTFMVRDDGNTYRYRIGARHALKPVLDEPAEGEIELSAIVRR